MQSSIYTEGMVWSPRESPRLAAILAEWADTPYRPGQCVKGVGVDCVRFLAAVLQEWAGIEMPMRALPADVSLHNPRHARRAMKLLLRACPVDEIYGREVEPGDILVMGPQDGGPGHAVIVGPQKNTMWHATGPASYGIVHFTGLCEIVPQMVRHKVYRLRNREEFAA